LPPYDAAIGRHPHADNNASGKAEKRRAHPKAFEL
jgi:hypothetical protein